MIALVSLHFLMVIIRNSTDISVLANSPNLQIKFLFSELNSLNLPFICARPLDTTKPAYFYFVFTKFMCYISISTFYLKNSCTPFKLYKIKFTVVAHYPLVYFGLLRIGGIKYFGTKVDT